MDDTTVQIILDECKYLWEGKSDDYLLVRRGTRYIIYHVGTQEIHGTEVETVNQIIWSRMLDNGVQIRDDFPSEPEKTFLRLKYYLSKVFG